MIRKLFLIVTMLISIFSVDSFGEIQIKNEYTGINNSDSIIQNIDYFDMKDEGIWSKSAVYSNSALGILEGYGSKIFGRKEPLTKEQALAMILKAIGKGKDALIEAENIELKRKSGVKIYDTLEMWSDGFIQIAAKEGLISKNDLSNAFLDPSQLPQNAFKRKDYATREDMAYWMAKALKIESEKVEKVYNNFFDWNKIDPLKIRYVEAILENNIMNGDGSGNFYPLNSITREQAAQVLKNAEKWVLPFIKMQKKIGEVIKVEKENENIDGINKLNTILTIKTSKGDYEKIKTIKTLNSNLSDINEQTGENINNNQKGIIYYNKELSNVFELDIGERVNYYIDDVNNVKYCEYISNKKNTEYVIGNIYSVNEKDSNLNFREIYNSNFPIDKLDLETYENLLELGENTRSTPYNSDIGIQHWKKDIKLSELNRDELFLITIENDVISNIKYLKLENKKDGERVETGIVQENNPALGFLTLYNENGTGVTKSDDLNQDLRTFKYNLADVSVQRNKQKSSINDVIQGDTIFIKMDNNNKIISISAMENYTSKNVKVIRSLENKLLIRYQDGKTQNLDLDKSVIITNGTKMLLSSDINEGDNLKLLISESENYTKIKEIQKLENDNIISKIYKAKLLKINDNEKNIVVYNTMNLMKGMWQKDEQKAYKTIDLAENFDVKINGKNDSVENINKVGNGKEIYCVSVKDFSGKEKVVLASLKNENDGEIIFDDEIIGSTFNKLSISKAYKDISLNNATIVIKDGKLSTINNISDNDRAYIVTNYDGVLYNAGIIEIKDMNDLQYFQIYRGIISDINKDQDFTISSFSEFDGLNWQYFNTPKTFNIDNKMIIAGKNNYENIRNFVLYGDNSYKDSYVYVISDGIQSQMLSTADYGSKVVKGTITQIDGTFDEYGNPLTEPSKLKLWKQVEYNNDNSLWDTITTENEYNILKNSIIIKKNKIIKASDLKFNDKIKILKKDDKKVNDLYVVIVEE